IILLVLFFFFQAEDGIRDFHVTGVQTCALPIYAPARVDLERSGRHVLDGIPCTDGQPGRDVPAAGSCGKPRPGATPGGRGAPARSEERRVGKECRSRWSP